MFHLCFLLGVVWFLVLTFRSLAHLEASLKKQKRETRRFPLFSLVIDPRETQSTLTPLLIQVSHPQDVLPRLFIDLFFRKICSLGEL